MEPNTDITIQNELSQEPQGVENTNPEQQQETISDWMKDKRAAENGMWYDPEKKTACPNRLYQSYRQIEPKYTQYQQVLGQYGIKDHTSLAKELQEYQQLKAPDNERNVIFDRINQLYANPATQGKLVEFFEQVAQQEIQDRWGQNLPPHVIQQLQKVDSFEQMFQQQQQQQEVTHYSQQIEQGLQGIMSDVQKYGLNSFDASGFLSDCMENQIPPNLLKAYFRDKYYDELTKGISQKVSDATANNFQKNKAGVIPVSSSKSQNQQQGTKTFADKAKGLIESYSKG